MEGINQETRKKITRYIQILFVALAFGLMVIVSYLFVSDIERKHLRNDVKNAITNTEANIKADMLEPETILAGISETIRSMILLGIDAKTVNSYIQNINNYMQNNEEKRLLGVNGFYGFFDVYGGVFLTGDVNWMPPDDYDLQNRPLYIAAVEANGDIGVTQPYFNIAAEGEIITFVRRIFNDDNKPLGIICLNIFVERLKQHAINTQFAEKGYGFLLNQGMELIAHPDPSLLGVRLRNVRSYIAAYEDELERDGYIYEIITTDYRGIKSIVFIERLYNGWYMGVVTPYAKYYQTTRNMALFLTVLGTVLAVILIIILGRISAEIREVTKKQADAEAQMNQSKQSLNILTNILNGIDAQIYAVVPNTGEILFVNDFMKRHYNIKDDCTGKLCYKIFMRDQDEICDFCPCYQLDKDPNCTVVWEFRDPYSNRIYRNTDRYIEWTDGRTAHIQHSVDITEIIDAKEHAEQSSRFKSQFLSHMSHEVRTPMNAILGITEIQLQNEALLPEMQEAFGRIYNSGYLLLGIINDILDLSKIEAGKLELVPVNYDVPSLINDVVHLNIIRFDNKPIVFDLQVDEKIPLTLSGDELRIKQILNNLLSNAFKYTDTGKVSLSIAADYGNEHGNAAGNDAAWITLVFIVSDTGQGMTGEQLEKLFDEYTRFNQEANRTTEGAGLGMNITKRLVDLMNGDISVESSIGKGSVFTVRLPQKIVDTGVLGKEVVNNLTQFRIGRMTQMKNAPQIVREYMPYGKVLITDDVETNLYVAKGLMSPYGLTIETAGSGFEAIEKIKNGETYDIIFMDHFMPKMDGIEATNIIRSLGYTKPIVALTANALTGQTEIFLESGFDGFISKPIDIHQLNSVMNKFIRDKYPADIVEAARLLKSKMEKSSGQTPSVNSELLKIFTRDAEKAFIVLEMINKKQGNYGGEDIKLFVINVHAMKSALANIGETELSDFASKLEKAGHERDNALISEETPVFLSALRAVVEKNKLIIDNISKNDADNTQYDDINYFFEKLAVIKNACAEYDKKTAKKTLSSLRKMRWPHPVVELMDKIAEQLLHGEFDEAAKLAENYKNGQN
jgi:signal transduction histidine kinase/DNA-binding response OmpR family regulator